ncbi:MAG: pyridoxal phosphate-dependent aminotransferase [Spirochaetes bacterium]|nr:pyridoxal phosphate-dependent aminotransferase [Spirochaetota bacterium]
MKLAKRSAIEPSLTLAMNSKAKEMKAKGVDVISFAAGEPDFNTPAHVKEAGKRAIDDNKTYYTPASGIPELKMAVAKKLERENGLKYTAANISINSGAKHSVFNVLSVLVDEKDEVIVPAPYWVSYSEMVRILGGKPVFIATDEKSGFKITTRDLEKAVTERTKVFLMNSPNNPTGAVYTKEELYDLARWLEEKDIVIVSDEIYEKILYDGFTHTSIASYSEKIKRKTVIVNGVSKAFSMTGWRIGYAAGPVPLIEAVNRLQGHATGNPSSIAQWASLVALTEDAGFIEEWVGEFKKRRDYIVGALNGIPGISCTVPRGAFYVFPNVQKLLSRTIGGEKIEDSMSLANYLLERGRISVVPGIAFGQDGYIRISFATSMENITEGMRRLKEAVGF